MPAARPPRPPPRRAGRLPGQRRQGLPRRPAAGHQRPGQRARARRLPGDRRHARRTATTSSRCTRDLVYATPGLQADDLGEVLQGLELRRASRATSSAPTRRARDVTIVRDKGFGVPHVYGDDARRRDVRRSATPPPRTACSSWTCCATWAARSSSSFAGGARATAPWTQSSGGRALHRGRPRAPDRPRRQASRRRWARRSPADADNYIAGINHYIAEAKLDPTKMPGEYAAIDQPTGPGAVEASRPHRDRRRWSAGSSARAAATSSRRTQLLQALPGRASAAARGRKLWRQLAAPRTPRRPTTVAGQALPLPATPPQARAGRRALPDRGSVTQRAESSRAASTPGATARSAQRSAGRRGGLLALPDAQRPTRCSSRRASRSRAPARWSSARRSPTSPRRS